MSRSSKRKHQNPDLKGYRNYSFINEGTYGAVFKAEIVDPTSSKKKDVAIKTIFTDTETDGIPQTSIREISLLRELDHENIVELLEVVSSNNKLFLVFEFMPHDLSSFMAEFDRGRPMPLNLVCHYAFQILRGIEYCHSHRVLHRDIKPQNMLLDVHGSIKLADFGLARTYTIPIRMYTHEVVTLWYRSPEILLGCKNYSTAVDIWSIGCVIGEMLVGTPLFKGESEIDQLFKIFQVLGTPNINVWSSIEDLPYNSIEFPKWRKTALNRHLPELRVKQLAKINKRVAQQVDSAASGSSKSSGMETGGDFNQNETDENRPPEGGNGLNFSNQDLALMQELIELIDKMLTYDPRLRISAKRTIKSKSNLANRRFAPTRTFLEAFKKSDREINAILEEQKKTFTKRQNINNLQSQDQTYHINATNQSQQTSNILSQQFGNSVKFDQLQSSSASTSISNSNNANVNSMNPISTMTTNSINHFNQVHHIQSQRGMDQTVNHSHQIRTTRASNRPLEASKLIQNPYDNYNLPLAPGNGMNAHLAHAQQLALHASAAAHNAQSHPHALERAAVAHANQVYNSNVSAVNPILPMHGAVDPMTGAPVSIGHAAGHGAGGVGSCKNSLQNMVASSMHNPSQMASAPGLMHNNVHDEAQLKRQSYQNAGNGQSQKMARFATRSSSRNKAKELKGKIGPAGDG